MISKRLKSLAKYVDKQDKVIDIGCDHALLDIYLIDEGIAAYSIVSDEKKLALQSGIDNIKKHKMTDKIETRLGSGMEVIKTSDDVDTILISGMGTTTILNILNDDKLNRINKLIIQSNNDHSLLRSEVVKKGFYISDEEYFVDNKKNYINVVFRRGKKKYSRLELKYGPILIQNREYLEFELKNVERISNLVKGKFKILRKLESEKKLLLRLIKKIDF